jgi:hypothetical protein
MSATDPAQTELTPERRALLARKGEILYAKSCGAKGRGICAEGHAIYQLRLGNEAVVRDYLQFLEGRLAALESDDPEGLRAMTEGLIARIRESLGGERAAQLRSGQRS